MPLGQKCHPDPQPFFITIAGESSQSLLHWSRTQSQYQAGCLQTKPGIQGKAFEGYKPENKTSKQQQQQNPAPETEGPFLLQFYSPRDIKVTQPKVGIKIISAMAQRTYSLPSILLFPRLILAPSHGKPRLSSMFT